MLLPLWLHGYVIILLFAVKCPRDRMYISCSSLLFFYPVYLYIDIRYNTVGNAEKEKKRFCWLPVFYVYVYNTAWKRKIYRNTCGSIHGKKEVTFDRRYTITCKRLGLVSILQARQKRTLTAFEPSKSPKDNRSSLRL